MPPDPLSKTRKRAANNNYSKLTKTLRQKLAKLCLAWRACGGRWRIRVLIGMELLAQLTVGRLDLLFRGGFAHSKDLNCCQSPLATLVPTGVVGVHTL